MFSSRVPEPRITLPVPEHRTEADDQLDTMRMVSNAILCAVRMSTKKCAAYDKEKQVIVVDRKRVSEIAQKAMEAIRIVGEIIYG